jgi:hypothetical protein
MSDRCLGEQAAMVRSSLGHHREDRAAISRIGAVRTEMSLGQAIKWDKTIVG